METTGKKEVKESEQEAKEQGEQCMRKNCGSKCCSLCAGVWSIFALMLIGLFIWKAL
jgi:hypothetical protein